jgi:hypothetical protein
MDENDPSATRSVKKLAAVRRTQTPFVARGEDLVTVGAEGIVQRK